MSRNPDSIVRLAFTISKYGGALPVTWFSSIVTVLLLIITAAVFYMTTLTPTMAALASEQALIEKILTIIRIIRMVLVNLALVQGFITHKKHDIFRITRSIYRTHVHLCKMGLVPDYKRYVIGTLVSLCIIIPPVETAVYFTLIDSGGDVHKFYLGIYSRVASRVTRYLYLAQALSLLGLSLDQLSCATKALTHQNQWYLELLVTVHNHVLKNVKDTFAMFEGYFSYYVVLLPLASIIYAYRVYSIDGIWMILLCIEFIELILILGVFETMNQVATNFNDELFEIMRKSKALCYSKKLQLQVTLNPNVKFTACRFFDLNFSLVTSMIAATATYLVILIQFSNQYS